MCCLTFSHQDTLTIGEVNPVYHYAAINKAMSLTVPHQTSTDGVQYAVSTKTASKERLDEPPILEDPYTTVDKEKVNLCHQYIAYSEFSALLYVL